MIIKNKGFTLIELLVVIAIIGILASMVFVNMNVARVKARDTKRKSDLSALQKALESYYYKNNNNYPEGIYYYSFCNNINPNDNLIWSCTPGGPNSGLFYRELVTNSNLLSALPADPSNIADATNKYDAPVLGRNLLAGGPSQNRFLLYYSDGNRNGYVLGTNLEQGGIPANKCGNYQVKGGDNIDCPI